MPLAAGTRLGPYEIVAAIGAGGMGEVYKATDTRLSRTVAIKVLPLHWVADAEMKERFEREAQTIASLKHPNICVLHDIGRVPGEGAAAAPGDETDFLVQGVIHRDLKPSNVMLTSSGPKLLDFGLAKTQAGEAPARANSMAGKGLTVPGMLVGTLQYMAPEQLEGHDADARTDIFALGVLLHEMVTGKKAFEGKSRVLLMSAIATTEPQPLSSAGPAAPPALDHVVKTCMAKDPADRWQTARDLLAELQAIAAGGDDGFVPAASPERRRSGRLMQALAAAAVVAGVALSVPAWFELRGAEPPEELRFRVPIQASGQPDAIPVVPVATGQAFRQNAFAVSPDGRSIAMVIAPTAGSEHVLFVRPVGGVTPQLLPGTEDAEHTFWSPDSRSIAFVARGQLRKVAASGGVPEDLSAAPDFVGGTWNAGGTILFGSDQGLYSVPAEGGTPELVTAPEAPETGHYWPQFLPDGRHYLYTAWGEAGARAIFVGTLGSNDRVKLVAVESNAAYVAPPAGSGSTGYLKVR